LPWYRPRWLKRRHVIVPVVRLAGVIGSLPLRGGLTLQGLEPTLAAAFGVKYAPVVALAVNSPGGSPVQSSLIAGRIRDLAREKEKTVVAFVEDIAASGGYWLALAADEIFVDRSSIVGSIGVISTGFGLHGAIDRLGIERRVHTTGPRKSLLDPFRPEQPGDLEVLRELQADIFASFRAHVLARRGGRLRLAEEELFSGRVWSGEKAVAHGLVDGLGELRALMRERHGEKVRLRVMNRQRNWLQRRFGSGGQGRMASELAGLLPEVLAEVEAAALWRRYGL
jgi:signal peptide peptidase SppA